MSDARARSVDAVLVAAGLDPTAGVQVVGSGRLAAVAFDPSLALVVLAQGRAHDSTDSAAVLPGRHARRDAVAVLRAVYPDDHRLERLPNRAAHRLADLDGPTLASADWLVPPLDPVENLASPHGMAAISARLRAPDGCPWDRKQTHMTLRPYLLEEAYETVDAIEHGTPDDLAEELGDLLLQVILHAQFAAEEGRFDLTDVYRSIAAKIVRRHPHVFGDVTVDSDRQLIANWDAIKAGERAERGKGDADAFDGAVRALPALAASRKLQERVARRGWDWDAIDGVWEKVGEELDELRAATSEADRLHELGDSLFALVNLARWMELDPEEALRSANHRWLARFREVEALAAERGIDLDALDLAGKDELWDEVKRRRSGS